MKTLVRIACVFTEIQTNHLPNESRPTDLPFTTSAVAIFMMVRLWTTSLSTEESGFDYSLSGSRDISFATTPRPNLGPTHTLIHCIPWTLSPGIKRPRLQAYHSLPLSAEDVSPCSYTFILWQRHSSSG
jgi:hypothetical protein